MNKNYFLSLFRTVLFLSTLWTPLALIAHPAHAQRNLIVDRAPVSKTEDLQRCSTSVLEIVGKHFGVSDFSYPQNDSFPRAENGGIIISGVCKAWPKDGFTTKGSPAKPPSLVIAAFTYDAGVENEKALIVAQVDLARRKVIASYKSAIEEDGATEVNSNALRLDMARYTLSKEARAFGLRLNTFRERCAFDGGYDNDLTLFVIEGRTIRPVFSKKMSEWTYPAGNRCGSEIVERISTDFVIAVASTQSHGFADLRITAKRGDTPTSVSTTVRYDGVRYR